MKKLFLFAAFAGMVFTTSAQTVTNKQLKSQYGFTEDTAVNTTAKSMTSPYLGDGAFTSFSVMADYAEISGTTAGTAKLQYSLDGSIYATLPTDSVFTALDVATNSYMWSYSGKRTFGWIKVLFTPTGTMSDKIHARFVGVR